MSCRVWIGNQRRHHFVSARAHLLSSAYMRHQFDYLVLGSAIAGLSFALQAARHGSVAVVAKRSRGETDTAYAPGGIAAVFGPHDRPDHHITNTLAAGAGLRRKDA